MRHIVVIGIAGKAQSGKSTTGGAIKRALTSTKFNVSVRPLAAKLKQICEDLFDWDGDKSLHYDSNGNLIQDKGRQLLINVGTDKMRSVRPTVWVDYVIKHLRDFSYTEPQADIVIIDDVRFKNEVEKIRQAEDTRSILIKVTRSSQEEIDNISEKDLDDFSDFDYYIENNGTIEELEEKVAAILKDAKLTNA